MGVAQDLGDLPIDARLREVGPGQLEAAWVDLVGGEVAAGLAQGQAEPEPGVTVGRADLDDRFGPHGLGQQPEHPAVLAGHVHGSLAVVVHGVENAQDLRLRIVPGPGWLDPGRFGRARD